MLPESKKRELHRSAAAILQNEADPEPAVTDLAHHFALGFGPAGGRRAIQYCQLAAEQAEQIMAFDVATRFWHLAITCTHPNSRLVRARLFSRLGWSLWAAGKWEQAVEAWNKAVLRYQSLNHRRKVGELSLALGDVHRWRMELDEARRWLKVALTSPLARADRARALALLANTLCLKREVNDAKELLEEATRLWDKVECDPLVAFWLSHSYLMIGRPSQALSMLRSGFEEARGEAARVPSRSCRMSVASHYLCVLDIDAAISHIASAEQAIAPGDVTNLPHLWSIKVYLLGYLGQWKKLIETCETWMARTRLAGSYQTGFCPPGVGRGSVLIRACPCGREGGSPGARGSRRFYTGRGCSPRAHNDRSRPHRRGRTPCPDVCVPHQRNATICLRPRRARRRRVPSGNARSLAAMLRLPYA